MEGPRAHLHVIGLQEHAALRAPISMQREDQVLEAEGQEVVRQLLMFRAALAHALAREQVDARPSVHTSLVNTSTARGPSCSSNL